MGKFDKINEKRRANTSVKQAKIKQNRVFEDEVTRKPYIFSRSEKEENSDAWREIEEPFDLGESFLLDPSLGSISINGNFIERWFKPKLTLSDLDSKFDREIFKIQEELSIRKKDQNDFLKQNNNLREIVVNVMNQNKKQSKQLNDLREELHDTLVKYGDAIEFIRDYIIQMKKENKKLN